MDLLEKEGTSTAIPMKPQVVGWNSPSENIAAAVGFQ
jgi:hypothetical protein